MSVKGRIRFSVAGMHSLLGLVRSHFISRGFALVPWDEECDFCLIGAEIENELHPPFAQLELQKMQVDKKPVLLLSSPKVYCGHPKKLTLIENSVCIDSKFSSPDIRSSAVYSLAAEHLFGLDGECLTVRPFNVYGPDIMRGLVYDTIAASRRKEEVLLSPTSNSYFITSFIHQDDFLKSIDKLLSKKARGVFNIGSPERSSYIYLVGNIWKFVNGSLPQPALFLSNTYCDGYPSLEKLEEVTKWRPKTSLRSGIFKMI
jgi:nucleoside-diphosphate-sugar epimerase